MHPSIHPTFSRRKALQIGAFSALAAPLYGKGVIGANETIRVGVIGCGSRAVPLTQQFASVNGIEIVAFADPDTAHLEHIESALAKSGVPLRKPAKHRDYRKLLDDPSIDLVIIASPNHWHTLHAIHAMQAGKDVYVEKPVCHSIWEGHQLIAAEKKYGRMICAGYQTRSDPGPRDGFQYVHEGNLGKVLSLRVCCFRNRTGIGKLAKPIAAPKTCDYDLWLGPAADLPIHRKNFHYDWHWVWNTGNGETGNQTPHEMDLAYWFTGDGALPSSIHSIGNRFVWDDAGQSPNMHTSWYELDGTPVTVEINDLHISPGRKGPGQRNGIRVGIIITCEGGELRGGRGGTYAIGEDGKTRIAKFQGDAGKAHMSNFINALRSRKAADIPARIANATRSAAIAHLSSISHLSGTPGTGAAVDSATGSNETIREIIRDQNKQLASWDISTPEYRLGKPLEIDPATETVKTPGVDPLFIKRDYRKGYEVPQIS